MNNSPRDIAWEVLANHFTDSNHLVFVPFANYNPGLCKIAVIAKNSKLFFYQTFRSEVDALERAGMKCQQELPSELFDEVLFVPSKQKIESLGLLAFSLLNLKEGGRFFYACHNQLGAGAFNSRIKEIFPDLEFGSSQKCRYLSYTLEAPLSSDQRTILNSWLHAAASTQVATTEYKSLPGIFGWNKVDRGSELLISSVKTLEGKGADLGAGYGYLSQQALTRFSAIESIALVEAELRALNCARENLAKWPEKSTFHWLDVCADETRKLGSFDWILMNPPFHDENLVDQDLGKNFIQTAAALIKKGGNLFMVANEFLAYEKTLKELFSKIDVVVIQDGFKVIHAKR